MNYKTLSIWMKIILAGFALCGAGIFGFIIPSCGRDFAQANPEFASAYWPWLIFLWIAALPCYAALVLGWRIAGNIARENAFSVVNAKLLKVIAILAAADAAFFFIGNIVLLFLNWNHPGIVLCSCVIVFIGIAICVAASALSRLTSRAADIEDENRYTI